jgi:hypothetical protein
MGRSPSLCGPAQRQTGPRPPSPRPTGARLMPPTVCRPVTCGSDRPTVPCAPPLPTLIPSTLQRKGEATPIMLRSIIISALLALGLPPHSMLLCPVSCRLEPPGHPYAAKHLRRPKLHPWVEPLCHEEGPKPTDDIRFPHHGRPVMDSSLCPPYGPDSTWMSFTPMHCSSLARQTPHSSAPPASRRRASLVSRLPPWSVFFGELSPLSIAQNQSPRLWHAPRSLPTSPLAAGRWELAGATTTHHGSSPCSPFPYFQLGRPTLLQLGQPVVAQREQCALSFSYGFNLNQIQ